MGYNHDFVTHKNDEYMRGKVHTQTSNRSGHCSGAGITGSYHKVSKDYLPLYLSEFTYRHNRRNADDPFAELISNA